MIFHPSRNLEIGVMPRLVAVAWRGKEIKVTFVVSDLDGGCECVWVVVNCEREDLEETF